MKSALYPHLGENDIMVGSIHEALRSGATLNSASRRALLSFDGMLGYVRARATGNAHEVAINQGIKKRYISMISENPPHATAKQIKSFLGGQIWSDYFKFCFVRNPYDQVISDYFWRKKNESRREISFDDFLESIEYRGRDGASAKVSNWDILSINNEIAMDYVGKFESIHQDFSHVMNFLNINNVKLSQEKKGDYQDRELSISLTPERKKKIQLLFEREIEEFGYNC